LEEISDRRQARLRTVEFNATSDDARYAAFFDGLRSVVAVTSGTQREFERRFAPTFNPVALIAREVGWSALLKMLLDPSGLHGQGSLFLDAFLRIIGRAGDLAGSVRVRKEVHLGANGRADILLEWSGASPFACLIENKLGAADQDQQLERYKEYLERKYPDRWCIAYITLGGGPAEWSISREKLEGIENEGRFFLIPYSGEQSIRAWLAEARRDCIAERVRMFVDWMEEAVATMSENVDSLDPTTSALLSYITASPGNMELAHQVANTWSYLRKKIACDLAKIITDRIRARCSGLVISDNSKLFQDCSSGWNSFIMFRRPKWVPGLWISLSAAPGDEPWIFGIAYERKSLLPDDQHKKLFAEAAARLAPAWIGKEDRWWPWQATLPAPLTRPGSVEGLVASLAIVEAGDAGSTLGTRNEEALNASRDVVEACVTLVDVVDAWSKEHAGGSGPSMPHSSAASET
jgi:hypothetical protein